jgi:DNA repair protein RecO (recombination protein O)
MQFKTTGIILHTLKYSDSASIVTVFTKDFGKVSYMVYGVNRKKSVCRAGFLQALSIVRMDVIHYTGKEIHQIKEIHVEFSAKSIPYDPIKNALALFIAELLYRNVKETETNEKLYTFLEKSIEIFDKCDAGIANFHLVFLVKLSSYLGFQPSQENEKLEFFDMLNGVFVDRRPTHAHVLPTNLTKDFTSLLNSNYLSMSAIILTRSQRYNLLVSILEYYRLHIPGFGEIKSLEILKTLFD